MSLPGKAVEHNADSVDGGTFTWNIDLEGDERAVLTAVTEPGSDSSSGVGIATIIAIVAVIAILLVGGAVLLRSRRRPA